MSEIKLILNHVACSGISNSDPINLLLGPGAGGWALNSFKAGSYDVPTALDGDILSLMTQQVTQNSNSWFQFSAYGVSTSALRC